MNRSVAAVLVLAAGVLLNTGCAGFRKPSLADRFLLSPELKNDTDEQKQGPPPTPTLEEALGKLRRMMAEARPPSPGTAAAVTLESQNPELRAALTIATVMPTPAHYLEVAAIYRRYGLLDKAYDYYMRILRKEPSTAEAHEGLARIWRDWGLSHLALADVHRAIYYEPRSASARNTLGTILQALGQRAAARRAYLTATTLDEHAAFAYNNLCYLSFLERRTEQALLECRIAIRLDPGMAAARNNLGLIYAATGRLDLARREFDAAGGPAASAYNMGVVYLAQQRFAEATAEFETAYALSPPFAEAGRRARYARLRSIEQDRIKRGTSSW